MGESGCLPQGVVLLDGGFGHEFKLRYGSQDFFAGTRMCVDQPDRVSEIHEAFFDAASVFKGSSLATTNSFVATPYHVAQHDSDIDVLNAVRCAAQCAVTAREPNHSSRYVAGSLPPLGECYERRVATPEDERVYEGLASTLALAGVDVLLAETLSSSSEACAALRASHSALRATQLNHDVKVWICFSLADDDTCRLRGGESLGEALQAVLAVDERMGTMLAGVGVNCCSPAAIDAALDTLVDTAHCYSALNGRDDGLDVIVYGNGFRGTTSQWLASVGRRDCCDHRRTPACALAYRGDLIDPEAYAACATRWARRGATVIGGCCGIGPEHMAAVARKIQASTASIRMEPLMNVRRSSMQVGRPHVVDPEHALSRLVFRTAHLWVADMWLAQTEAIDGQRAPRLFCRRLAPGQCARDLWTRGPGVGVVNFATCRKLRVADVNMFFATPNDEANRVPAMTVSSVQSGVVSGLNDFLDLPESSTSRPIDQIIALAMARHARLGRTSPARDLPIIVLRMVLDMLQFASPVAFKYTLDLEHIHDDEDRALMDHLRPPNSRHHCLCGVGIITTSGYAVGFDVAVRADLYREWCTLAPS